MKKLLTLIVLLVIFTSCTVKTYSEDPQLKESERIAVLEKAKTDTLVTVIDMDNKFYFVKDNKIKTISKETDVWSLVLFLFIIFIISIIAHIVRD